MVNTKFPEIGELLLTRVVLQFRRAYKRNDKPICIAASKFLAHLVNQQVRLGRGHKRGFCGWHWKPTSCVGATSCLCP